MAALVAGCADTASTSNTASTSTAPTTVPVTVATTLPTTTLPTTAPPSTSTTTPSTTTTVDSNGLTTEQRNAFEGLEAAADRFVTSPAVVAISVAVAYNGEVLHSSAATAGHPAISEPITTDTRFRLASVSKVLTSTVILQLVEEGLIDLDSPFVDYLQPVGGYADPRFADITVRQLLTHSSGLGPDRNLFFGGGSTSWYNSALVAFSRVLDTDPGTAYRYSNSNFCLLGLVIERVTGQPFDDAVRTRLAEPLGITGMRLAGTFDSRRGDAPYLSAAGRTYMEALGPAGAWIASAPDIALIYNSLQPGAPVAPLSSERVDLMRTPVPLPTPGGERWTYGTGMMLFGDSWGHTGTIEQARTVVINLPNGYTVAVLVSGDSPADGEGLLRVLSAPILEIAGLPAAA